MTVLKQYDSVTSQWIPIVSGTPGANGPEGGTTTLTTKGDLLTRSASAIARLGVGANGSVLKANSSAATGLEWGAGSSVTVSDTSPSSPAEGNIWYESDTGKFFVYYDSFWVEVSGADGLVGGNGPAGTAGATGATGATGIPLGPKYTFSTTTVDADPGAGIFRYNNAAAYLSTQIYISTSDGSSGDRATWLDSFDDSSSTIKGILYISTVSGSQNVFQVTSVTTATGYRKLGVTWLSGSVQTNGTDFYLEFARTGDIGTPGAEGGTTTLTTKGDILTRTASAVARLGVGSNGSFLLANSSTPTGVEWGAIPPSSVISLPVIDNFKLGFTTTATSAGTTTLTNASNNQQMFTGSTTQTVVMPVANTMTVGTRYVIENNSTGNLTINSSGSNLIATVIPGTSIKATSILASGTDALSWDVEFIGFNAITGTGPNVLSVSPALTGTPTAPTAAVDTNTTQVATTAYVVGQGYAKLASPALSGTPTAPTATTGTSNTQLATTAFVNASINASTGKSIAMAIVFGG